MTQNQTLAQPPEKQLDLSNLNFDPTTGERAKRPKVFTTIATAERWLIEQARVNPLWFTYYMTELEPATHHRMWFSRLFNYSDPRFYRLNFIAPREAAKTTLSVYGMTWFISRFPWATNAIISVSSTIAEKRLEMIRNLIDSNERYANVFPWIHTDARQRNTITQFSLFTDALYDAKNNETKRISYNGWRSLITKIGSPKDPTINCGGISSKSSIGSRWSGLLLLDDIIDFSMLTDKVQDETMDLITMAYIPMLQPMAKAVNIGTRWMINDIPARLQANPAWHTVEIPAIKTREDGTRVSYWPSYWSIKKLDDKKKEMNNDALFDVMYMNDPRGLQSAKFIQSGLGNKLPAKLPDFVSMYVGTDFAIGLKVHHDFNAFSAVGFDRGGIMYILRQLRFKDTPDVVLKMLIDFCNQTLKDFGILTRVLFEKVGFQVEKEYALRQAAPHLSTDFVTLTGNKDFRINFLATKTNNNEVLHNTEDPAYPFYYSEALNYSPDTGSGHDDMLDSAVLPLLYHTHDNMTVVRKSLKSTKLVRMRSLNSINR